MNLLQAICWQGGLCICCVVLVDKTTVLLRELCIAASSGGLGSTGSSNFAQVEQTD